MKRTIKSGLSLAIAVVMCLSLLPMTALAANVEDIYQFDIENGVLKRFSAYITNVPYEEREVVDAEIIKNNGFNVVIPSGVTSIGDMAFDYAHYDPLSNMGSFTDSEDDDYLMKSVIIPNGVTSIGNAAFRRNRALTSITIPVSVTSIGNSAFDDCKGLTAITIPNSVTSIGEGAFFNCTSLTNVTIPESVTNIGRHAFNQGMFSGDNYPMPNLTLHVTGGSYAEKYAKDNGYKYVSTGGTTPSPDPTPTTPPKTDNAPNLDNASGWAQPFINEAYNNGLIPSTLQSSYTQATTRAEFCALAVTLYETIKGTTITDRKTFDDTTDINVEKAAAIGVVSGVGNNKFDPNAKLTREQAAVMLARLAEAVGKPFEKKAATFADNGKIATWAVVQVGQIQAAGIMSGTGNNMFSPQDPYTREQSITTINRMYGVLK